MANLKDYSGTKLGFLKIIEKCNSGEKQTQSNTMWRCFCEGCNTETFVSHKLISSKKKTTCGCGIKTNKYSPGNKYGLLTIVKEGERDNVSKTRRVWCICDCGNEELTLVRTNNLSSGNTTSCGCVGIKIE